MTIPDIRPPLSPDKDRGADATVHGTPVLLRVEDAAALLKIGRSTAYELIRTGQLASVKIGGSRRVPRSALDDLVDRLPRYPPTVTAITPPPAARGGSHPDPV